MISDDELLLYYYREDSTPPNARASARRSPSSPSSRGDCTRSWRGSMRPRRCPKFRCPHTRSSVGRRRWHARPVTTAWRRRRAGSSRSRAGRPPRPRWRSSRSCLAIQQVMPPSPQRRPTTRWRPRRRAAGANDASAYENGLKWHLASTEQRLASLGDATPEERARLVETIIGQNRIYALAAERAGEPQLARVLRAFTPILEERRGRPRRDRPRAASRS